MDPTRRKTFTDHLTFLRDNMSNLELCFNVLTLWRAALCGRKGELCDRCFTSPPRSQRGGICDRCDSLSLKTKQVGQRTTNKQIMQKSTTTKNQVQKPLPVQTKRLHLSPSTNADNLRYCDGDDSMMSHLSLPPTSPFPTSSYPSL